MGRSINRLSAKAVQNLATLGLHADGNGLYLAVSRTGAKSWRYIYNASGKRHELGLGSYPAVNLATARERAMELARARAQGVDPLAQRQSADQPTMPTFGQCAEEYIEVREEGWRNPKHRAQWRSTLKSYAAPIYDKPVDEVTLDDLKAILRPIWTRKHETATRVRGRIEAVLDAAKLHGHRDGENPAAWRGNLSLILPKVRKRPKHHASMPYDELPDFMANLKGKAGNGARALELLIHTACRTSEVIEARWCEFNLENELWIIPAERMKASKEHRVPLVPAVCRLLKDLPRQNEWLFPGSNVGQPISNMTMINVLKRMELGHYTVHGFRSSFRDYAGDVSTATREVAEAALAHQIGNEVERAYRRGDALAQRRMLMEEWSAFISGGAAT